LILCLIQSIDMESESSDFIKKKEPFDEYAVM